MGITKHKIDGFEIDVWTTDVCDPPCVAVNITEAHKALHGHELTAEELNSVTDLMLGYSRYLDERNLTGYGSTEFLAIADLFAGGIAEYRDLKETLNKMARDGI